MPLIYTIFICQLHFSKVGEKNKINKNQAFRSDVMKTNRAGSSRSYPSTETTIDPEGVHGINYLGTKLWNLTRHLK